MKKMEKIKVLNLLVDICLIIFPVILFIIAFNYNIKILGLIAIIMQILVLIYMIISSTL